MTTIREYYSYHDAISFINEQLKLMEQTPLTDEQAAELGVVEDMTFTAIQDVLRQAYRSKLNLQIA